MKKTIAIFAAVMAASTLLQANPAQLIENVYGRKTMSLNGEWRTIVDPTGTVKWNKGNRQNYALNKSFFDDETVLTEYDFNNAQILSVPGDWNSQELKFLYYDGAMWYRQMFDLAPEEGTRSFLYFGAANYASRCFFNGKQLGVHKGGFTPFNYEITKYLKKEGKGNAVVVRVDNTRHRGDVPTTDFDWWNYGGLTRDVLVVTVPETFIIDYSLSLDKNTAGLINGYVQLDGSKAEQDVTISIPELKLVQKVRTGADGRASFSYQTRKKNGLKLWSPENPKLYEVEIVSETDKVSDRIGFRTIATEGSKILLNGKPVFLRGIAIHDENMSTNPGRVRNAAEAKQLLDAAKELNCNFVRLSHYPHSEAMVRQAEEMGLMVWDEIPCYWNIDWKNEKTYEIARQQLEEMIYRDKNRAGVIIWSVANETPQSDERLEFLKKQIDRARELDGTRLVSAALLPRSIDPKNPSAKTLDDALTPFVDIMCFNVYVGWYNGTPEFGDQVTWTFPYEKPVMITEFGGGALYGRHGDKTHRFTEEYLVEVYKANLRMFAKMPQLAGVDPWILKDFRSPKRPIAGIQDYYNRKGLLSEDGKKKQAFYVMQEFYAKKAQEEAAK